MEGFEGACGHANVLCMCACLNCPWSCWRRWVEGPAVSCASLGTLLSWHKAIWNKNCLLSAFPGLWVIVGTIRGLPSSVCVPAHVRMCVCVCVCVLELSLKLLDEVGQGAPEGCGGNCDRASLDLVCAYLDMKAHRGFRVLFEGRCLHVNVHHISSKRRPRRWHRDHRLLGLLCVLVR
jgi:hypothetical protein